jgi:DNA-binding NtrC family response regulator
MPPLRERKEDIPLLVEHILLGLSRTGKRRSLSAAALLQLTSYEWPGNIRELQTFLEGAIALSSGPIIQPNDLPPMVGAQLLLPVRTLEEVEREAIKIALARTGGNKIVAARSLGIGKTTMYRKLQKYKAEGRKGRGK